MGIYPNADTREVLAGNLQGIWGGGVFSTGLLFPGTDENKAVFMEGTNDTSGRTQDHWGYSTESNHKFKHEHQWDEYRPGTTGVYANIRAFTEKVVEGTRFRVAGETAKESYTILGTTKKLVYKNTQWRMS